MLEAVLEAVQEQVQRLGPNGSVLVPVDFALKQQYSRAERLELQTQAHCTTAFARTCLLLNPQLPSTGLSHPQDAHKKSQEARKRPDRCARQANDG